MVKETGRPAVGGLVVRIWPNLQLAVVWSRPAAAHSEALENPTGRKPLKKGQWQTLSSSQTLDRTPYSRATVADGQASDGQASRARGSAAGNCKGGAGDMAALGSNVATSKNKQTLRGD